jgi:hypothetical protein
MPRDEKTRTGLANRAGAEVDQCETTHGQRADDGRERSHHVPNQGFALFRAGASGGLRFSSYSASRS